MNEKLKLNAQQQEIIKEMQAVYVKAQAAGIAFAMDDNANVVAYNAEDVEDCEPCTPPFGDVPNGFEYVDVNEMQDVFSVWGTDDLCVKIKK